MDDSADSGQVGNAFCDELLHLLLVGYIAWTNDDLSSAFFSFVNQFSNLASCLSASRNENNMSSSL
jgi:hypothetical protein